MNRHRKFPLLSIFGTLYCLTSLLSLLSCKHQTDKNVTSATSDLLTDSISKIVAGKPGEIGVALIIDNSDTVTVNNRSIYPMMSVFKLHQALAICKNFDDKGISLDSTLTINRDELDPDTWSPMLKEHAESKFSLTVKDLLRYTLIQSDNNASSLMFRHLVGIPETDKYISALIPRASFKIAHTEAEMSVDHERAYSNYTSPLGAAILINRLYTDSLVSGEKQQFLMETLKQCETGKDRIVAPLLGKEGIIVAHKTGSGYVNQRGELAAHNDVAFIRLPNNVSYSLAVFVKDFKGTETEASRIIARISATVYSLLSQSHPNSPLR